MERKQKLDYGCACSPAGDAITALLFFFKIRNFFSPKVLKREMWRKIFCDVVYGLLLILLILTLIWLFIASPLSLSLTQAFEQQPAAVHPGLGLRHAGPPPTTVSLQSYLFLWSHLYYYTTHIKPLLEEKKTFCRVALSLLLFTMPPPQLPLPPKPAPPLFRTPTLSQL
jgi:hypothetical protein